MPLIQGELNVTKRYFCVTYSERPYDLAECDLNYLERRYSRPDRLCSIQAFETLQSSKLASPYGGEIAIYDLGQSELSAPQLIARIKPQSYKPQHAIWYGGRLWVAGVERIEIYDTKLRSIACIQDQWLAGGHTILPDGNGKMLVSCSASDSVLVVDEDNFCVIAAMRLPTSLYGNNYILSRNDSVVDHYITNDLQIAHVNCASPWRGGVLTSSLIPGSLGWFDPSGEYSELLSGFVGCHGARAMSFDEIYFCDSCVGTLMMLNDNMQLQRRVGTGSRWLHDAIQIKGNLFALAIYDSQEVWFIDVATRELMFKLDCRPYGWPQFLGY